MKQKPMPLGDVMLKRGNQDQAPPPNAPKPLPAPRKPQAPPRRTQR